MVRALLAGRKTQTRRVVKPQLVLDDIYECLLHGYLPRPVEVRCPYGMPGDLLWVRETFARIIGQSGGWIETDYRATYKHGDRLGDSLGVKKQWTPSIYMPRAESRLTLRITEIRVERLQDISHEDCRAEGCQGVPYHGPERIEYSNSMVLTLYKDLWESINGAGSWDENPRVWALSFEVIHKNIDGVLKVAA